MTPVAVLAGSAGKLQSGMTGDHLVEESPALEQSKMAVAATIHTVTTESTLYILYHNASSRFLPWLHIETVHKCQRKGHITSLIPS